jgi:HEPN domain-containing protein
VNEKVSYWLETADYDLATAQAMLETRRLLYVGFMCHQVIEKALKAVIANAGAEPPRSHRLRRLAELGDMYPEDERPAAGLPRGAGANECRGAVSD